MKKRNIVKDSAIQTAADNAFSREKGRLRKGTTGVGWENKPKTRSNTITIVIFLPFFNGKDKESEYARPARESAPTKIQPSPSPHGKRTGIFGA